MLNAGQGTSETLANNLTVGFCITNCCVFHKRTPRC